MNKIPPPFLIHQPCLYLYIAHHQISGGWDRRILIWCLETGELQDRFRNTTLDPSAMEVDDENLEELACDGVIIDMEYCASRYYYCTLLNIFHFASATFRHLFEFIRFVGLNIQCNMDLVTIDLVTQNGRSLAYFLSLACILTSI